VSMKVYSVNRSNQANAEVVHSKEGKNKHQVLRISHSGRISATVSNFSM